MPAKLIYGRMNKHNFIMKTDMKKIIFTLVSVLATALNAGAQTTLFKCGTDSRYYRIPAILNQNGTLWAFTDDRTAASGDIGSGNIKIVAKTSSDNGSSWSSTDQTIVSYDASASSPYFDYAHGDAAVVCDREDPQKMLLMCASGNIAYGSSTVTSDGSWGNYTLNLNNAIRVGKYTSSDGGQNWSGTDVTSAIYGIWDTRKIIGGYNTTVTGLFFSSGRICQSAIIKNGDYYRLYAALCTNVGSLVVYSDDFGETWSALGGTSARPVSAGDEAKIEELPNGNVLISSRTGGRYFNIYTYTDQSTASGSWGSYSTVSIGSSNATNGEILLVPAVAKDSNLPVYIALQSVPTGTARENVSIYWKLISSVSDVDAPSDFQSGWTQYQVSSTSSAYSTMTLDNSGNIAFLYEENAVSSNGGCYDIQFQSLSLEKITSEAYTYTSANTAEVHRTAFLNNTVIDESGETTDPWEGKVVTLKAKVINGDEETLNFYLHNEGLNLKVETAEPTLSDYSYYWVISKNTATGNYYLSSLKGDGYLGKGYGRDYSVEDETEDGAYKNNIPVCTDDYTQAFEIVEFSKSGTVNTNKSGQTMVGYALKFAHSDSYRWVAVSEDGAINWFDHTSLGETTDYTSTTYWATDFEINVVDYVETPNTYGTWDNPTYFNFPVKFARSDNGKAVVAAENYNYYATLKLPFAVTLPDGVAAYEITGPTNKENQEVGLKELTLTDNILPYETPVLLSKNGGEGSDYPASKTIYLQPAKHHDIVSTGFNGSLGKKSFQSIKADSINYYDPAKNANFFILGKKNGRVAFYYLADQVLAANKAYYVYDGSNSAKTLTFSFQDSPSAIGMPEADDEDDMTAPVFDLAGRRITGKASKGVYIRNGKKFVVR